MNHLGFSYVSVKMLPGQPLICSWTKACFKTKVLHLAFIPTELTNHLGKLIHDSKIRNCPVYFGDHLFEHNSDSRIYEQQECLSHKHIHKFNCTKLMQGKIHNFCGIYRLERICYCSMFLLAVTIWQQFVWSATCIDENTSFFPSLNAATTFYQKSSDLLYDVTDLLKLNKKQMYSAGNRRVCTKGQ